MPAMTTFPMYYGTEFASKAMDAWAYQYCVQLDFIRPGRPVENCYIESFNGRLRDECLNVQVFFHCGGRARQARALATGLQPGSSAQRARATAHPQCSRRNGLRPRRPVQKQFRFDRKSPRRAIHWRYSLESVECKKRRPDRP